MVDISCLDHMNKEFLVSLHSFFPLKEFFFLLFVYSDECSIMTEFMNSVMISQCFWSSMLFLRLSAHGVIKLEFSRFTAFVY